MHKILVGALAGVSVAAMALPAYANCDKGEIHIKFSHVTNTAEETEAHISGRTAS